MKIGIIGAGQVGQALAKKLVKAGYHIIISNSKGG
jgi:predicted dinucleotide-binding enzyme